MKDLWGWRESGGVGECSKCELWSNKEDGIRSRVSRGLQPDTKPGDQVLRALALTLSELGSAWEGYEQRNGMIDMCKRIPLPAAL